MRTKTCDSLSRMSDEHRAQVTDVVVSCKSFPCSLEPFAPLGRNKRTNQAV
jgi:hypothetical protein